MVIQADAPIRDPEGAAGFAVLDNKGRLALPKSVRAALGVHAGSAVAYVLVGEALLVVPQDAHLASLLEKADQALAAAGLSAKEFMDELPAVRHDLLRQTYGDTFVEGLERRHATLHVDDRTEGTTGPD